MAKKSGKIPPHPPFSKGGKKQFIGIIGGSGLYSMSEFKLLRKVRLSTPFGKPSDDFMVGTLSGVPVVFLPRHGVGHRILPSELNFRANIWGMKKLGVASIVSVSAVGSLKAEIEPGHMVVIDQFIDRTRLRPSTFFGGGVVAHVSFADPVCGTLREKLISASKKAGAVTHEKGTYVCMEGPLFSTRAESHLYRSWGADVIGMTNLQEAKLAREAEICYATLALSTDYDCWHESEAPVTAEMVFKVLCDNVSMAQKILAGVVQKIDASADCTCRKALKNAIFTDRKRIPAGTKKKLGLIIGKYL
ncbi:MAG: S-methyl-5'-thioadenosine phosphorylase [Deltaproteobacteria bacterium]|nr:S-methyl-5'-thioadenosine phosphorylase [Deltaproteobacteria bacterium]